jgi:hypothetical protein
MDQITHRMDFSPSLDDICFKIYNRLRLKTPPIFSHQIEAMLYSPAYHLKTKLPITPQYSFEPRIQDAIFTLEPDRIIHLMYGSRQNTTFVIWSDLTNEYVYSEWIFSQNSTCVELLNRTRKLFGSKCFNIRLVVTCVDGWTIKSQQGFTY